MSGTFWSPPWLKPAAVILLPLAVIAAIAGLLNTVAARSISAQTEQPLVLDALSTPGRLLVLASSGLLTASNGSPRWTDWSAPLNYRIYESPNQGHTWTLRSLPGLQFASPTRLVLDPADQRNLFVVGLRGVYFKEGDQIWRQVSTGPTSAAIHDLMIDPTDPRRWFAATTGMDPVQWSRDAGYTWESAGLQTVGGAGQAVLVTPDGRMLFAIQSAPGGGGTSLHWRNPDGVWAYIPRPATLLNGLAYDPGDKSLYVGSDFGGYALDPGAVWRWRDNRWAKVADFGQQKVKTVGLDPGPPKTLFANVNGEPRRSTDDGRTWEPLAPLPAIPAVLPQAAGLKAYYDSHDGWRVLGRPLSEAFVSEGLAVQYFEKGRLEDHALEQISDPNWRYMYGLLADELQNAQATLPVGGEVSTVTYVTIHAEAAEAKRAPPPAGFAGGAWNNADGSVFIPYDAHLRPGPGHNVDARFWALMNRTDLFPGGWLHDIGLPLTEAMWAKVTKGQLGERDVLIQAFQRAVLTFDSANPPDWEVELANVGSDYRRAFPGRLPE